ncbi:hypothetical protein FGADI_8173 [Fusarium gaditjirri]|uniref:Mandelate racemase/muconate lactonizing enzyme N-terminal domain-containing protein n=1 Tax=Fusarium gaditjirri TaxID=282569 RepID=A0A8H4T2Z0_9HYPO|nr:hypothetical protein FGADI_8173 [Fusarium gaditjirri]
MSELKIAKIDVFKVDLPYSGGVYYLSGGREYTSFDATSVRITTNAGIEGWAESTPFGSTYIASHALGVRAGIAEIAPWLIGGDPGEDAQRITASLADKRPGEFFLVDASGGLAVENAFRPLRLLPPGLDFVLEAPYAIWRETVSLR